MGNVLYELKGMRVSKKDSQVDIAKYLGIAQTTYTKKENGDMEFKLSELKAIKERYNLTAEQFEKIFLSK